MPPSFLATKCDFFRMLWSWIFRKFSLEFSVSTFFKQISMIFKNSLEWKFIMNATRLKEISLLNSIKTFFSNNLSKRRRNRKIIQHKLDASVIQFAASFQWNYLLFIARQLRFNFNARKTVKTWSFCLKLSSIYDQTKSISWKSVAAASLRTH